MNTQQLALTIFWVMLSTTLGYSQNITPYGASWYGNDYLKNPALAGANEGASIAMGYRQNWISLTNKMNSQYLMGEMGFDNHMGAGIQLFREAYGALSTIQAKASYAYHLPVAENHRVHFGVTASAAKQQLDLGAIAGDPNDPLLAQVDERGWVFDAAVGLGYSYKGLAVQVAATNVLSFFDDKEFQPYFAVPELSGGISYGFQLDAGTVPMELRPQVFYRAIEHYGSTFDAGVDVSFNDRAFEIFGLYHSSKNMTVGAGVRFAERFRGLVAYRSSSSSARRFSAGNIEVGLAYQFYH